MISALCAAARTITVLSAGPLNRIVICSPPRAVRIWPHGQVPINRFARADADGLPVAARTPITLSSTLGQCSFPGEAQGSLAHPSADQHFVTGGCGAVCCCCPRRSRARSSSAVEQRHG